jgi:hypothetical protein
MKKTFSLLTLTLIALIGMGFGSCNTVNVPANSVTFRSPSGQLTITHPQNTSLTNLDVEITTNGTVHAKIGGLVTFNSPEVIDKVSAGQVAIIKAQGDAFEKAARAGGELVGAGIGTAAKTAK